MMTIGHMYGGQPEGEKEIESERERETASVLRIIHDDVMVRKTSLTDKYKCSTVAVFRPYAYSDSHRAFLFISVRCAPTKSVCASAKCFPSKIFGQRRRRRRDAGLSSNICADHSSA